MTNPIRAAAKQIRTTPQTNSVEKAVRTAEFLLPGQADQPHFSDWSTAKAVKDGYTVAPPLYACIDRIMKAIISVRLYTERKAGADAKDWREVPDHPLTQLIYNPNPSMSKDRMLQYLVQHKYLGGNALWSKIRVSVGNRRVPVELWPIPPDKISPIPGSRDFIRGYKLDKSILIGGRTEVPAEDIIHWQFANPNDPYWGIAPLMALAMTVDTDVESLRWNLHSMHNRARSSGVLAFDQPISEEQWAEARKKIKEQHQGAINANGVMIMPHGVTFTPWSMSPAEMDFIESRKFAREDICAVHGLMPPAVGYMDDATLANVEVADRAVWRNAAIPLLKLIVSEFNNSLAPEFGPDIRLAYDLSDIEVLKPDLDLQTQIAERFFKMGVPFNLINHRLNLDIPDFEGGDRSYLPISLIPADEPHPSVGQQRPLRELPAGDIASKGASPSDVSTSRADEQTSWSRPTLSDFTDKSWDELTSTEKRRIAGHYAYARTMPPETFGDLALPHHRPSDGAVVLRGVVAAAARFNQTDIPDSDKERVKAHLRRHYRQFDLGDDIPDVLKDIEDLLIIDDDV